VNVDELLTDLAAESADLDDRVAPLDARGWARLTPAEGWTIGHQIAHLVWTDRVSLLAATDEQAFYAELSRAAHGFDDYVDRAAAAALRPPDELLPRWRAGRRALADALRAVPAGEKLPWYGSRMSPASMATARLMETWAHGQDVADALGQTRTPTARLRHVAHLGVRTLGHSFATRGRDAPTTPVRVELVAPDGTEWAYGPADAPDRVTGPALDFCLLVTQRRHRADLALLATGPVADEWLDIAQAFAGPPGTGRAPVTTDPR
jgi:uncharacterized protein (TIGR03084 family)